MDQNKEFDKYIKGLLDKNPEVPSELNWENMEFELPEITTAEPVVIPTKEKDRKYLLLLLLLLLIGGIGGIGFGIGFGLLQPKNEVLRKQEQLQAQAQEQALDQTQDQEQIQIQPQKPIQEQQVTNTQKVTEDPITTPTKIVIPQTIMSNDGRHTDFRERKAMVESTAAKQVEDSNLLSNHKLTGKIASPSTSLIVPSQVSTPSTPNQKSKVVTAIPLSLLPINTTVQSTEQLDDLAQLSERLKQLIPPTLPDNNDAKKSSKIHVQTVLLGYGINTFNPVLETSNGLHGKINSALGNSFRAGLQFKIMENWSSNIMIKYDRYHTTLDHRQELEAIYDFQNGTKINREEITFHNNFTNTLGLALGVEKRFSLNNQFSFFTGVQITPTYILNVTGKTVINQNPAPLTYDSTINRLSLQGGLQAGLLVAVSPKMNLKVAYEYSNFLMGDIFINNNIGARQLNAFSLTMEYRFRK